MGIDKAPEVIAALQALLDLCDRLGVPGVLAILLAVPAALVAALLVLEYLRTRHMRQEADEHRKEMLALVEQHRADMEKVLRDLGAKHAEVTQFYKDNVELVKSYNRLADNFQDIVVNNTRAVEHLASLAQANFFCPIARESATGKK